MKTISLFTLLFLVSVSLFGQKERPTKDSDTQQKEMQQAMSAMFGGKDCQIADAYTFDHQFTSKMTSWDKSGKEESWIKSRNFVSDKGKVMGVTVLESNMKEMPSSTMVMDLEGNRMITLMDQQGSKMALCLDMNNPMFGAQGKENTESAMPEMRKTGRKQTLLGYSCDEWVSEDENMKYSYWLAEKVELPMAAYYDAMSKQKLTPMGLGSGMPAKGMMLLMEGNGKTSKEKVRFEVLELKPKTKSSVSTAGYQRF